MSIAERCECGQPILEGKPHNHPEPSAGRVIPVEEMEWEIKAADELAEYISNQLAARDREVEYLKKERIKQCDISADLAKKLKAKGETIRPYTSHKEDCHLMYDPPDHPEGRCTCGLEQALKGSE